MVFNHHKKIVMYCLIGAVFTATLLLFLMVRSGSAPLVKDDANQNQEVVESSVKTVRTNTSSQKPSDYLPSITYTEALTKYKNSRIQFNDKCQAIPNNITYKNNTYIMLDNRAPFPQVVNIDNSYALEAGGFQIIKLSSDFLPMKWYVNCGNQKNVATILLQQ